MCETRISDTQAKRWKKWANVREQDLESLSIDPVQ